MDPAEGAHMNVVMINGSRRAKGCTYTGLGIVSDVLSEQGIDSEVVHVTDADAVSRTLRLLPDADGLVIGSPVYWAGPSGEAKTFLDLLWGRASRDLLAGKPCAILASARRAGTTTTLDALAKYPEYAEMPLVSSFYWPLIHGVAAEDVLRDEEGVEILRQLGANMAWMLRCIEAGRAVGIELPAASKSVQTNFIR
jgi:multimeric flavodoxin WrbA